MSGSGTPPHPTPFNPSSTPVSASKKRSRRANFTHAEIDALVFGYRSNRAILDSKGDGPRGTFAKQRVWERITRQLFAVSGIMRDTAEVKKKWSDLKSLSKKRGSTGVPVTGDVSAGEGTSTSMEANYGESHGEYIVPTSGASSPQQLAHVTAVSNPLPSIVLSDVRSLAEHQTNVRIKEEIIESADDTEDMNAAGTFSSIPSPAAPLAQHHLVSDVPNSFERDTPQVPPASARAVASECAPGFLRKRKRTAGSGNGRPVVSRKARLEMEVLLATKRKLEAEERRADAEAEFYQEEKKRSMALASLHHEERRKMAALADFHAEERRKAAAKADLLMEHKNMYFEQQKTEVVRRRLLLIEIQKVRRELKLLQ